MSVVGHDGLTTLAAAKDTLGAFRVALAIRPRIFWRWSEDRRAIWGFDDQDRAGSVVSVIRLPAGERSTFIPRIADMEAEDVLEASAE